jgi:hypothetical protein
VYYFDEKLNIDSFNYSSIGGNTQNGYATQEQDNTAYAAFGSVNLAVTTSSSCAAACATPRTPRTFNVEPTTASSGFARLCRPHHRRHPGAGQVHAGAVGGAGSAVGFAHRQQTELAT